MGTVVGQWRLNLIIFMLVILVSCYTANSFFADLTTSEELNRERWDTYNQSLYNGTIGYNESALGQEQGADFISLVFGLGDYLTFGNFGDNWAIRFVFTIVTSVCWIIMGYIIYTFIKEWIPLT